MNLNYATLDLLRMNHPAWRLLRSDHAPLVASLLHRVFIMLNVRVIAQADLSEMLENELFALRSKMGRVYSANQHWSISMTWLATTRAGNASSTRGG